MNDAIYWLIEKESPAKYLMLSGKYGYPYSAVVSWTHNPNGAYRFACEKDALLFLGLVFQFCKKLSYEDVMGMEIRPHEDMPRVCDHQWVGGYCEDATP